MATPKSDVEHETLSADLSTDKLVEWYSRMELMRRFENHAERYYQEGKIAGYHHIYSGQEAVAMGIFAHLGPDDHIITAYRDHGPALARGIDPKPAMAELWGKATGTSQGKGGSMHLASRKLHFWGGYAIVAAHLSLATGIALAEQYKGHDTVTVCMFGDGSTNNGYFHEALNLAKVWDLPILFVCENNLYGMWTPVGDVSAVSDVYKKACGYEIPAKQIDGMNVLHVYDEVAEAIDHIRAGNGPYFIEALTYRYRGHGAGDIEAYRTKDEVAEYKEKDPLVQLASYLADERDVDRSKLETLAKEAEGEINAAVEFARESEEPALETIWDNIFAAPFEDRGSVSKGRS
ncbi:MAG: pyruvate dehydrogenase (acetyl-transferring) E1 component subunit alpha [Anaerolineales bacterium]|nr:pyruvate dehydrogenase (acetyl-transferring) E1 component subunit alpha [Anaerolineales bacterium]MCB9129049.1 pyruvate dehydrogenase (acetyl-transferring) E1 component subunit alpha [Ardenticatenales bacterium]